MDPAVTTYSGLPRRAEARVDLPEPLGPMRAWTSPSRTVRSTPRRISARSPLAGSSAATWSPSTANSGGTTAPNPSADRGVLPTAVVGNPSRDRNVHSFSRGPYTGLACPDALAPGPRGPAAPPVRGARGGLRRDRLAARRHRLDRPRRVGIGLGDGLRGRRRRLRPPGRGAPGVGDRARPRRR